MTQTMLFAKVLGAFMIIVGLSMVLRRQVMVEVAIRYAEDRPLRIFFAAIELLAGLLLVALHNVWDPTPALIVTLVGWLAVAESTAYLMLPDRLVLPFLRSFANPAIIAASGALAALAGLYLAVVGFGVI
jgi:hypothetical protein